MATTLVRPVSRVILNAVSLASAPELAKYTRAAFVGSPAMAMAASRSASSIWGGEAYRLLIWPRVPSWLVTAATTAGWACPSPPTAMPLNMSVYRLPSASHRCTPSPRTKTRFGGPKLRIRVAS